MLHELFDYGTMPYVGMSNPETAQKVLEGYRMPKTRDCTEEVYKLMLGCWNEDPGKKNR